MNGCSMAWDAGVGWGKQLPKGFSADPTVPACSSGTSRDGRQSSWSCTCNWEVRVGLLSLLRCTEPEPTVLDVQVGCT